MTTQCIRRHECNRIKDEIRQIDMSIEKSETSAARMRNQGATTFIITQLNKIHKKNLERKNEKKQLSNRLEQLLAGQLDTELRNISNKQMQEAKEKSRLTKQKKIEKALDKEAKSVISKAFYQADRKQDRKNRYQKKNIDRSYRHFLKACNSIPPYMRRNLAEMPNNKGYCWKSVACYGDLPAEIGQPQVLFDRRKGNIMIIHEWTHDEYRIYQKKGKERKVLVSSVARKKPTLHPICADMVEREREAAKKIAKRPRSKSYRDHKKKTNNRTTKKTPNRESKSRTTKKTPNRESKSRTTKKTHNRDSKKIYKNL